MLRHPQGGTVDRTALSTRDENLPAAYSTRLEALSLAPLWTALHALLPHHQPPRLSPHQHPQLGRGRVALRQRPATLAP